MDMQMVTDLLASAIKRPQILHRDEQIISSEDIDSSYQVVTIEDGKKYAVTTLTTTVTSKTTVVREYDPTYSYADQVHAFTNPTQ